MKQYKITLGERDYYLFFSADAMFRLQEQYGAIKDILDALVISAPQNYEVLIGTACILSEAGELARRHMGYDKGAFLTSDEAHAVIAPMDMPKLRNAVIVTISVGYGREVEDKEDKDLTLIELERKQGK